MFLVVVNVLAVSLHMRIATGASIMSISLTSRTSLLRFDGMYLLINHPEYTAKVFIGYIGYKPVHVDTEVQDPDIAI